MAEQKAPTVTSAPATTVEVAPPPEPQSAMEMMMTALVGAFSKVAMTPDAMRDILMEVGKSNAEMAKAARWPENAIAPGISAYSYPEGDVARPKPKLGRDTYFCGVREQETWLTPSEILAYNAIAEPRVARGGSWRAELKRGAAMGAKEELFIWVPKETVDQRMDLPVLHLILHELNGGPSTQDIESIMRQLTALREMVLKGTKKTAAELEAELLKA